METVKRLVVARGFGGEKYEQLEHEGIAGQRNCSV